MTPSGTPGPVAPGSRGSTSSGTAPSGEAEREPLLAAAALVEAGRRLADRVSGLRFSGPVAYVYTPLEYARGAYEQCLPRWGDGVRRVVFLGMNPGPWGMVQTGVPFGEVGIARDWLSIDAPVGKPDREHPRRPVLGWSCPRSEISGQRLWGLFRQRFRRPERFFAEHFVANYCPLVFLEESGRNRTPDKLPVAERAPLLAACDAHLRAVCAALRPAFLVGVGRFAALRAREALAGTEIRVVQILHPSPASPRANQGWAAQVEQQLEEAGIW